MKELPWFLGGILVFALILVLIVVFADHRIDMIARRCQDAGGEFVYIHGGNSICLARSIVIHPRNGDQHGEETHQDPQPLGQDVPTR